MITVRCMQNDVWYCTVVSLAFLAFSIIVLRCMGTRKCFSATCTKENSFSDSLIASLETNNINRTYHRSLVQIEKSLPEGKRIMPETRFTSFPALSVGPKVGISRSALKTNDGLFFLPVIE